MEKSSSVTNTNSLEDHNSGGRSAKIGIMNEGKAITDNYSWGISSEQNGLGDGGDLLGGFSWPPRSYTCTFCKREFRSAQALGGHMNVHRRDRARLRQMPCSRDLPIHPQNFSSNYSLFNLNQDPNPHPNPNCKSNPNPNMSQYFSSNLSSTPTMFPSFTSTSKLPPLMSSSPSLPQPNLACVPHSTINSFCRLRPRAGQNLNMMKSQIPPYGVCKYDRFPTENEGKSVKKSEIVKLNLEIGLLDESKPDDLDLELRLGCS
ncbi:hypothetical protein L2E82_03925 [Cichorium intybus]|uniref:Uncharacterized protein n=1 Tax=Cichorium intybus TaxID=13427 RepID=A0ACB9H4L3_CICIN|nr:hypothetical protein L2E82_03925 [Cichorium intybus]